MSNDKFEVKGFYTQKGPTFYWDFDEGRWTPVKPPSKEPDAVYIVTAVDTVSKTLTLKKKKNEKR